MSANACTSAQYVAILCATHSGMTIASPSGVPPRRVGGFAQAEQQMDFLAYLTLDRENLHVGSDFVGNSN